MGSSPTIRTMKLYSVTAINGNRDRCVAICSTLDRAKEIVENNEADIWELEYDLVVVESTESDCMYGGFPDPVEQYWYEWTGPRGWAGVGANGYTPIERPVKYKNVCGFGIG